MHLKYLGNSCHICQFTNYFILADSLQLDRDACGNLHSMIIPCCGDLRESKGSHHHRIVDITENAGKCLLSEYAVRDFKSVSRSTNF